MTRALSLVTLILALLAAPLAAEAQQVGKVYRIGRLSGSSPPWTLDKEMLQVLRDHGWVEGRNLVLDYRYAEGRFDRLPALASELLRARPDVIFATGDPVIKAAKDATSTVPIVMIGCDAVAAGLIVSLAGPGGNLTGITCISRDIAGKRIELLRETWPRLARLAVLYGPDDPGKVVEWKEAEAAGQAAGLKVGAAPIRNSTELEATFASLSRERAEALIVPCDVFTFMHARQIASLAATHRLPAIYGCREFVTAGGLMSYGPNLAEMWRQAALYIDKVLTGTKPADLPVEQPTKFELVINLKTAKALGLTIPPSVLARADEVIQ
jgi:putative ABC transport system substrate-binding protein